MNDFHFLFFKYQFLRPSGAINSILIGYLYGSKICAVEIHHSIENLPEIKNPVVTTGSFDGVHVGHRTILRRLKKCAEDLGGESVLVTFHPHPRRVLYPDAEGKDLMLINSQQEKKILLAETGLDHLIIIPFTRDFATISCEDFVEEYLYKRLGVKKIIIGFNHQFGYNRKGNFDFLYQLSRRLNFDVEEIPEQDIHNESVSSTRIRKAIKEGNIQRANAYLDHLYTVKGKPSFHRQRSEELGIEVLRLSIDEEVKLLPADGVYAVNIRWNGTSHKAMFSITGNQLVNGFNNPEMELEFHCPEVSMKEREEDILVFFHKLIRKSMDGEDIIHIRKQISRDLQDINELIY